LIRLGEYPRSEEMDLRQELTLRVLKQARLYNPERGSLRTFVGLVLDSAVGMLRRSRCALKHATDLGAKSLDSTLIQTEHGSEPLTNHVNEADRRRWNCGQAPCEQEEHELAMDIRQALVGLPAIVLKVASLLPEKTEASAAKALGISRRQVRNAVDMIRERLESAGL
jgi:DNA-directed RNA polymerase specialized sigma24 family protein